MAAPAFVSVGTLGQGTNGTSGVTTVPIPGGVNSGELLVLQYHCQQTLVPNTPSGWTKLFGPVNFSSVHAGYVFYKVSAGSEGASVVITKASGAGNFAGGIISVYSGAHTTTPVDIYGTGTAGTGTTTVQGVSVTTTQADTLLLRMFWAALSGGAPGDTGTPSAGTERYDVLDANFGMVVEVATVAQAVAGASGTTTLAVPKTILQNLATTVALASGTPPVVAPVANFTGTPLSGPASLNVAFTDTSTNVPTSWAWTFGDGGSSTSQNPSRNYTTAGTYTVALVATNAAGSDTETKVGYVVVAEPNIIRGFSMAFDDPMLESDPTWTRLDG